MATITLTQSGNWSDNTIFGPWPSPYTLPAGGAAGDDVVVPKNLTLTLDTAAAVAKSLVFNLGTTGADVGGKLTVNSTVDTKLVVHTSITFNGSNNGATFGAYSSIIDIDMSTASTKKCEIYTNGAGATSNAAAIDLAGKINLKGLTKTRWTLTAAALVGSDDGTGALTCDVDDATGWQVADKIVFATTQAFNSTPKVDKVTIATITAVGGGAYSGTGAATITWTDGTGTSPSGSLKYSHADNCLVGNLHSNLIFGPVTADQTFAIRVACGARNTGAVIDDIEIRSALAPVTFGWAGVLILSGANGSLSGISFNRNAFYDWTGTAIFGYLLDGETPRSDNQFYSTKSVSNVFVSSAPVGSPGVETDICIYRSTPSNSATYVASYAGTRLIDPKISGVTALGAISLSGGMGDAQVSGGGIWSCYSVAYKSSGTNPLCTFTDTYLGKGFPGSVYSSANNSYIVNGTGAGYAEFNNCLENLSGGSRANGTGGSPASETAFYNKNGVIADQEAYAVKYSGTTPVYVRDTSVTKNATASLRIDTIADAAFSRTFDILVKGGVATSLFVYARKTGTFSTRPTAQLTGLGTSLPAVTMSTANNTWELLDLSYDAVDAPASDGLLTLTLSCQAASSLSAYFSGIPIPPWNSRSRHYGSMVNESSATQVADPAIDPAISVTTAAGYGGAGVGPVITWGATSSIATEADTTFKKLVHYTASQMIDNVGSALPITWAGAYNSPAIFAQGNITTTGYTLNGGGSLAMGGKTLTASVPWSYTYTGGTFSQAASVPAFSGGTLNIGAAGTYTFDTSGTIIVSMTPTAPGTYVMGDVTASEQLDLRNTSAHAITVELSTAVAALAITSNNVGGTITISAPVVTADISITGMANTVGANNRLQIINQTAAAASAWQAATVYAAGDVVLRTAGIGSENTAGLYMRCTSGGTSGGSEPTWATTVGVTTTDNTVTWTTYAVLFYDADPAGTSLTDTYIDGEEFLAGETIEIRFAEEDPGVTFKTYGTSVVATADGFSALANESDDSVYATYGLSGAAYETTYSPNFVASYIVLDTNTDFGGKSAYAYYCYLLTTSQGMYRFWGGFTGIDPGNIRNNVDVISLYFDESTGFVKQTDDVRIFRSDGLRPALDPTTGGSGIEMNWRVPVNVVTISGASVLTPTQDAKLMAIPTAATTASATRTELAPELAAALRAEKFARNKKVLSPTTGVQTVYDDDGTTVLGQGDAFMDVAGAQPYDGTAPVHRTERLA